MVHGSLQRPGFHDLHAELGVPFRPCFQLGLSDLHPLDEPLLRVMWTLLSGSWGV